MEKRENMKYQKSKQIVRKISKEEIKKHNLDKKIVENVSRIKYLKEILFLIKQEIFVKESINKKSLIKR